MPFPEAGWAISSLPFCVPTPGSDPAQPSPCWAMATHPAESRQTLQGPALGTRYSADSRSALPAPVCGDSSRCSSRSRVLNGPPPQATGDNQSPRHGHWNGEQTSSRRTRLNSFTNGEEAHLPLCRGTAQALSQGGVTAGLRNQAFPERACTLKPRVADKVRLGRGTLRQGEGISPPLKYHQCS